MPTAPRTHFPYPDQNSNPWGTVFQSMVDAIDASLYAGREDRNVVTMGGGTMAFTASSGVLSWTADIELLASFTGYVWRVAGPGSLTVTDGQAIFLTVTRAPQGVTTYTLQLGSVTSNEPRGDDQLLLGFRRGTRIHFRDGFVLNDGDSRIVFDSSSGIAPVVATPHIATTLVNGANQNIPCASSYLRLIGPTAPFSIGGFAAGIDGQQLTIYNTVAFAMTVSNEAGGSTLANRITTLTGADIVMPARISTARFIYDGTDARWIYLGAS